MKKLLFLLSFIILNFTVSAQNVKFDENYNFKILNGNVAWQYIYNTNKSSNDIASYFNQFGVFNINQANDSTIIGRVRDRPIDAKSYGFPTGLTPMYLIVCKYSCNVLINIKDSKYRVTLTDVSFDYFSVVASNTIPTTLGEVAYNFNRNKFKNSFNDAAEILSTIWYDTYLVKNNIDKDNNW